MKNQRKTTNLTKILAVISPVKPSGRNSLDSFYIYCIIQEPIYEES
jgi:hypothetical protein